MPFIPDYDVPDDRKAYTLMGNSRVGCLALHGFLGSPASSRPLAVHLASQGITVHCPLLPGHGHYPNKLYKVSRHSWVAEVEEAFHKVRQLCDELFIIAHSMGTILASHLILKYGHIKGLIMLAPVYNVPDARLHLMPFARYVMPWYYPHKSKRPSMQKLLRERLREFDPTIDFNAPEVQERLPTISRVPTSGMAEMVKMVYLGRKFWPQLTLPIRIFQGGHDQAVAAADTETLYGILPSQDKKLNFFPEAGHELMRPFDPVHPQVWSEIVTFLQTQSQQWPQETAV